MYLLVKIFQFIVIYEQIEFIFDYSYKLYLIIGQIVYRKKLLSFCEKCHAT